MRIRLASLLLSMPRSLLGAPPRIVHQQIEAAEMPDCVCNGLRRYSRITQVRGNSMNRDIRCLHERIGGILKSGRVAGSQTRMRAFSGERLLRFPGLYRLPVQLFRLIPVPSSRPDAFAGQQCAGDSRTVNAVCAIDMAIYRKIY